MKKLLFSLIAVATLFTACDKFNDQFTGLDETIRDPRVETNEVTLQSADYATISTAAIKDAVTPQDTADAKSIGTNKYFSATVASSEYIPYYLKKAYNTFDEGSACIVTFNYKAARPDYLPADTIIYYTLTTANYTAAPTAGMGLLYARFSPDTLPQDHLPAFLAGKYPAAGAGAGIIVNYKYGTPPSGSSSQVNDYYYFDGVSWSFKTTGIYWLSSGEYDDMGESVDKPGQYNNFSSSVSADYYLPLWLKTRFITSAASGDVKLIGYAYFVSGKTMAKIDEYKYDGSNWIKTVGVYSKTEQYVFLNSVWTFDPSVKFTMQNADYKIIVDYVKNDPSLNQYMDPVYKDTEYYYGVSYKYNNYDFRLSKRQTYDAVHFPATISSADALVIMNERLVESINVLLQAKYPTAIPNVGGIDVFYTVNCKIYDGVATLNYSIKFQCTATGTFTFIEGPTLIQ